MRVLLLDVYRQDVDYRISKDTNGSYGTGNDYGDSLRAKFLKKISKRTNFWPPLYLMYAGSVLRDKGHHVEYSNSFQKINDYDVIIMSSSIVCHETEIEYIKNSSNRQHTTAILFSLKESILKCDNSFIDVTFNKINIIYNIGFRFYICISYKINFS